MQNIGTEGAGMVADQHPLKQGLKHHYEEAWENATVRSQTNIH